MIAFWAKTNEKKKKRTNKKQIKTKQNKNKQTKRPKTCLLYNIKCKGPVTRVPHRPTRKKRIMFNAWKTNDVDKGEK